MPLIRIPQLNKTIEAPKNSNLMKTLLEANIAVASSCGGDGICGKCKMQVEGDAKNISIESEEEKFLKSKLSMDPKLRVSCQCEVLGDITVTTTYW